jgi:hypothetical protein
MSDELRTRLELQDLVADYARCVDRRDFGRLASLFVADSTLAVCQGGSPTAPVQRIEGRDAIASAMRTIESYELTTHFVGQQTVQIEGSDRARGETYCLAHHLSRTGGILHNYVMSIRYQDEYLREGGRWKFLSRTLLVDWTERRPLVPGGA